MRLDEIEKTFLHGSSKYLEPGTILMPRHDNYEEDWGSNFWYYALEHHKPEKYLSHKESVFMVGKDEDLDYAGGGTDYVFYVEPLGSIEKHDLNWSSEISFLEDKGFDIDSNEVKNAALNYWNGVPHHNENVWEYLTPKAKILRVEEF